MTNNDLFKISLDICKKEGKGMAVSPDTFGYYLDLAQRQYFELEFSKYEQTQMVGSALLPFVAKTILTPNVSIALPEDYRYHISARAIYSNSNEKPNIDIVTKMEYDDRSDNVLLKGSIYSPMMYMYRDYADNPDERFKFKFDGGSGVISTIEFTYMRTPPACIFDYYIDAEGEVIYLEQNQDYILQADEQYRDGTTGYTEVNSISRELWWNDNDKIKILDIMLTRLGIKMEFAALMQYSNINAQLNQLQP